MKKIFPILFLISLILSGCQAAEGAVPSADAAGAPSESVLGEISSNFEDLSKAQAISVIPSGSDSALRTITDSEEIEDFVVSLQMQEWETASIPQDAALLGSFHLMQEETRKLGQTNRDETLHEVCEIMVYDAPYLTWKLAGISMSFAVDEETFASLSGYFR